MNWYEKQIKKMGYKGCRNCKHQIEPLRTCEWLEKGGDGQLHLICPKWEKKMTDEQGKITTEQGKITTERLDTPRGEKKDD